MELKAMMMIQSIIILIQNLKKFKVHHEKLKNFNLNIDNFIKSIKFQFL